MTRLITALVVTVLISGLASAQVPHLPTTLYVDDDAGPNGTGTDFDPFDSIQTALNNSGEGDEIVVRPGFYFENVVLPGHSIAIRGSGGAAVTVIDASFAGRALTCATPVLFSTVPSRLEGLTLRSGMSSSGAGLYVTGRPLNVLDCVFHNNLGSQPIQIAASANVNINDCTFTANSGSFHMLSVSTSAQACLDGCTFTGNSADDIVSVSGAGSLLQLKNSTVANNFGVGIGIGNNSTGVINGCRIHDNQGSGITTVNATTIIDSCVIEGNASVNWGGGIYALFGHTTLRSTLIIDNTAPWTGGGATFRFGNSDISNCTVANNNSGISSAARGFQFDSGVHSVCNSIIRGNGAPGGFGIAVSNGQLNVTFSNIEGGFAGTGNFDADPIFVDPANGDYKLDPGSPCINVGTLAPAGAPLSMEDFEGHPRVVFGLVDIGSDEYFPGTTGGQGPRPNLALFDINGAGTPDGAPVTSLQPGPYYVRVDLQSNLNFDFEGGPFEPVICMWGDLNPGAATYDPMTGNLDIGGPIDPATGIPTGITVFIDGTGTLFPGYGALTDATGKVTVSFALPPFPPGVLTTFQAAIFRQGGCSLTNAVQVELFDATLLPTATTGP